MLAVQEPRVEFANWKPIWMVEKRYTEVERGAYPDLALPPYEIVAGEGNILTFGGVSALWQMLIGNGTGTAGQALTYFNNGNAAIGVGDSNTAEAATQTNLQAASNKLRKGMDATYPLTVNGTTNAAITGATNATPIVITVTSHGFSTGDVVNITGVGGNTAANGTWFITVVDANTFSLNGSVGNGAYTSGGVVTKVNCIVFRATFGASEANFAWNEWVIANSTVDGTGRILNRKAAGLGTKATGTWTLTVAVAIN